MTPIGHSEIFSKENVHFFWRPARADQYYACDKLGRLRLKIMPAESVFPLQLSKTPADIVKRLALFNTPADIVVT